jgi:hypothetical protein
MPWDGFANSIAKLALLLYIGREATARLQNLLAEARPGQEFTFPRLVGLIKPASAEGLAQALVLLEKRGRVKRVIRVESPSSKGGIGEYKSFEEVPEEIYDRRRDVTIRVKPEYLRVIYQPHT